MGGLILGLYSIIKVVLLAIVTILLARAGFVLTNLFFFGTAFFMYVTSAAKTFKVESFKNKIEELCIEKLCIENVRMKTMFFRGKVFYFSSANQLCFKVEEDNSTFIFLCGSPILGCFTKVIKVCSKTDGKLKEVLTEQF